MDTSVTTVYPRTTEGSSIMTFVSVAADEELPIVKGSPETRLPSGCSVSGVQALNSGGFFQLQSPNFAILANAERSILAVSVRQFHCFPFIDLFISVVV